MGFSANPTTLLHTTFTVNTETIFIAMIVWLIAMLVLIGVLALIARKMSKLSPSRKKGWLVVHLISVILYFSGLIGQLFLTILTVFLPNGKLIFAAHFFIMYFDAFFSIPFAFAVVGTGTWLATRTNWGLTKHYWVIAKWSGMLLANVWGTTIGSVGEGESFNYTLHGAINPLQSSAYIHSRELFFIYLVGELAIMFSLLIIAILKPWGKRKEIGFLKPWMKRQETR
jgi:hypothetical protein